MHNEARTSNFEIWIASNLFWCKKEKLMAINITTPEWESLLLRPKKSARFAQKHRKMQFLREGIEGLKRSFKASIWEIQAWHETSRGLLGMSPSLISSVEVCTKLTYVGYPDNHCVDLEDQSYFLSTGWATNDPKMEWYPYLGSRMRKENFSLVFKGQEACQFFMVVIKKLIN